MNPNTPNDQYDPMLQGEPSMSAPSPMPGKAAANYGAQQGWNHSQQPVYPNYQQQAYQARPSQGVPGGQLPPQQYGAWQQGYQPPPQQGWSQPYQPTGRGWTQPYPVQEQPRQSTWQGGYTVNQWSEPQQEQYIPGMPGGNDGSGTRPPVDRSLIVKLAAVAVVLVAALTLVISLVSRQNETKALQASVDAYSNLYCEGVYVDGIHLGGMTREEAKTAVQKSAQLKCDEWNVALVTTAGEYVDEINSYDLGMTVHVDDALNEAWRQGHTGATYEERKAAMDALITTPYNTSTALPSGDTAAIDRILNEIADKMYVPAVDAQAQFDPSVNLASPFTIIQASVVGRYLDVQSIKAQVYDMVSRMESGTIVIEPTPLYPSVTEADIARQTTLIGSHYTKISTTSTANRDQNIKRAAELINGTVIEPGRTFSFNDVVGPRTKKNGFELATVYSYGKEEEGYGGGVCQVSSTMYVAAVRANLEIVNRRQHGLVVGYTDLGLDATVNYDGKKIDFSFRNNTGGNIYIITKVMKKPYVDKNHYLVICDIYGPALEDGVTYDLVATTVEVPIPEPTTVPDKKAEHVVYVDETYTEPGRIGYEVDSYKVKYVNGELVEQTHMYHDTYAVVQPIIYTGVSERPH